MTLPDGPASLAIPRSDPYVLGDARVPLACLTSDVAGAAVDAEGWATLDLAVERGRFARIVPGGTIDGPGPRVELGGRQVWAAFVDMHTHLDKGQVIPRVVPDGTIHGGFSLTVADWSRWTVEDIERRMDFGLRCAHVHGVAAIRTHLDSVTLAQAETSFAAFDAERRRWAGRVELQGVAITPMSTFLGELGPSLADLAAELGGLLGGVTDTLERGSDGTHDDLDRALDSLFRLAAERGLDVDLHVDQSADPSVFTLPNIARSVLRTGFRGRAVCGHCVNLALQPDEVITETLALCRDAGLAFATMPSPMMYLMDRSPGRTPRWRGVTAAQEIRARGLPIGIGGDNCRDAWFAYGDHDMLDTLKQAIRILHLDHPLTGAIEMATSVPADIIGLPRIGRIAEGVPANAVIFQARTINTVLCRDQADRIVLSSGRQVNDRLPHHDELDDMALAMPEDRLRSA